MTVITVPKPDAVRVPRAAPIAAHVAYTLLDAVERAVHRVRENRAEARRVAEANAVRRYADAVGTQDPRFAADLYAAADRHERG